MAEYRNYPVLSEAVMTVSKRKLAHERMRGFISDQQQRLEQQAEAKAALMAAAPEILPEEEERFSVAFLATGSLASLKAMKAYALSLGITLEEIEQEDEDNE